MAGNKILVAGGAGYIGSFVVLDLYKSGFEPIVVDDLSSGHLKAISDFKFYKVNILEDKEGLFNVFKKEKPEGVIHLAGLIQMGESYRDRFFILEQT